MIQKFTINITLIATALALSPMAYAAPNCTRANLRPIAEYLLRKQNRAEQIEKIAADTVTEKESLIQEGRRYDQPAVTNIPKEKLTRTLQPWLSRTAPVPTEMTELEGIKTYFQFLYLEPRNVVIRESENVVSEIDQTRWSREILSDIAKLKARAVEAQAQKDLAHREKVDAELFLKQLEAACTP